MTFTYEIKQEILNNEFSKEQALDFIRGVIATSGLENGHITTIRISSKDTIIHIEELFNDLNISYKKKKNDSSYLEISTLKRNQEVKHPNYFLAGLFIGGGSTSDKDSSSYHLELQFHSSNNAKKLIPLLHSFGFGFNTIKRRSKTILYLKKQTEISDFLMSIFANKAALDFEDARIQRDMYNAINRYSNLDLWNQSKLARASASFMDLWSFIKENRLQHEFKLEELNFFELKEKNIYSSLQELSSLYNDMYNAQKTRSGLNHWIYKLKKIVKINSEEKNVR